MKPRLFRFCHSAPILGPFSNAFNCGWFDGGCVVLACALQMWLGGRLAAIARKELLAKGVCDHVILSLPDDIGAGATLYVDADGVTTASLLLECWRVRERLPDIAIEDPLNLCSASIAIYNLSWSAWLAEKLAARFGIPSRIELSGLLGRME